jgi:hypothetical protein
VTQYAKRDLKRLDEEGGYYQRHVSAMTTESLHFKSDIAAELAWRDCEYAKCAAVLDQAKAELRKRVKAFDDCEGIRKLSIQRDATIREQAAEIERLKAVVEQREQALPESCPWSDYFELVQDRNRWRDASIDRSATIRELREALLKIQTAHPENGWECERIAHAALERSKP